jgi:hypothetical protein
MAEKRRAESPTSHPLIEKVLASRPAAAELIGFNVEEISDGRAVGRLQGGRNTPTHGHDARRSVVRSRGRGNGHGLCFYSCAKRVVYDHCPIRTSRTTSLGRMTEAS